MAVNVNQRLTPLRHAKARRRDLVDYIRLDGSRYLLAVIVLLCLMSMIALGQTGVVATKGYSIVALERELVELKRERGQLQQQYAEARSLDRIRVRAAELGLRPMDLAQGHYLQIVQMPTSGEQPIALLPDAAQNE